MQKIIIKPGLSEIEQQTNRVKFASRLLTSLTNNIYGLREKRLVFEHWGGYINIKYHFKERNK
jgi:hypothetical protein